MSTLLTGAVTLLLFALLSMRTPGSESRTPADYWALARRTGWATCLLASVRVVLVAALLVLVDGCRLCVKVVTGAGIVFAALACAVQGIGETAIAGGGR